MYGDNPPHPGPGPGPRPGPGQDDGHGEPVSARRPARTLAPGAWLKMANMKAARLHTSDTN